MPPFHAAFEHFLAWFLKQIRLSGDLKSSSATHHSAALQLAVAPSLFATHHNLRFANDVNVVLWVETHPNIKHIVNQGLQACERPPNDTHLGKVSSQQTAKPWQNHYKTNSKTTTVPIPYTTTPRSLSKAQATGFRCFPRTLAACARGSRWCEIFPPLDGDGQLRIHLLRVPGNLPVAAGW